jgi:dienelactone hydrolase
MKYITITTTVLKLLHHRASASNADYNNIIPQPAGSPDTPINVIAKNYTDDDGTLLQGFLSLPPSLSSSTDNNDTKKKYPAVIILHDSDGPNEYEKQRASILSSQNDYVGFAADIFGYYTEIPDPSAGLGFDDSLTQQFFTNTTLFVQRIQAAVEYVQSLDQVDETKVAIIGYCFGGTGVVHYLNEMGSKEEEGSIVPLAGAIGVHPSLVEWSGPEGNINIPSLFLTGGNDFLTGPEAMRKLESDLEE